MTIALEQLADGSISDRNFQKLTRLVIDTGGLSMALRVVEGAVTDAGASNGGVGFTVTKVPATTGLYDIVFSVPFPALPRIRFGSDNGGPLATYWTAGDETGFRANVVNLSGTLVNAFFNFEATYIA